MIRIDAVRRHQTRADGRKAVKGLGQHPLITPDELQIPGRQIIAAGVAEHIVKRLFLSYIPGSLAHNGHQFRLVVVLPVFRHQTNAIAVGSQSIGKLIEQHRCFRQGQIALSGVLPVVQTDTKDLVAARYHRRCRCFRKAPGIFGQLLQQFQAGISQLNGFQHGFGCRDSSAAGFPSHIHNSLLRLNTQRSLAIFPKLCQFHNPYLPGNYPSGE